MWLEIHKTQSQYLFQKILKTEPFRIFEKLCHLNLVNMILNENSRNFYFLIANPYHIFLGKFLILTYCPKYSQPIRLQDFLIFSTQEAIKL